MFCKFCGNELGPEDQACSACGQKVTKGSQTWKLAVIILCAVVLIAVLVVAVLFGAGLLTGEETTVPATEATTEAPADQMEHPSYTVDNTTVAAKANDVIATVGKVELTNSELQMHYWSQVYSFLNNYSYYLSAMGLDISKGLDQQTCYMDATKSWQEYFLDQAIQSWQSYAVLSEMADAESFTLDAERQAYLDNLESKIQEDAVSYGYESVEDMLMAEGGPGFTKEGYMHYLSVMYRSMEFFKVKYAAMTPTDDEITAYFDENAAAYQESGAGKDAGKTVDVRHILISPEGGTKDESGNTTYSDAEWAACQTEAERVYQEWKDSEATEDSFAKLAETYSADGGSNTNGGLYTDVADGDMVETFNDWIMDETRKTGDHGLVKTPFGYHIMYYVDGEEIWYTAAKDDLISERFADFINGGMERFPMKSDYTKIGLGYIALTGEE